MSNQLPRRSFLRGMAAAIGAVFIGRPKRAHALPLALPPAATTTPPHEWPASPKRVVLSLSSCCNVLPGTTIVVTQRPPQHPFRAERIIIANANDWIINDFRIGAYSQLAEPDQSGDQFSDVRPHDPLVRKNVCLPAMDVTITTTYVGHEPTGKPFICGVIGVIP